MKYTCKWTHALIDGYLVATEDGLHLTALEVEAILNQEPTTTSKVPNVIHANGVYLIQVWNSRSFWSSYPHEGKIMFMDNPEVGTIATLPSRDRVRVKVIAIGTEHSLKGELPQMAVFVKPWPEIGVDGYIKD